MFQAQRYVSWGQHEPNYKSLLGAQSINITPSYTIYELPT